MANTYTQIYIQVVFAVRGVAGLPPQRRRRDMSIETRHHNQQAP